MSFPNSSFALAGKYTQIHLIGQGSGGNVYRALDNVRRVVAVKEVLAAQVGFIDMRARFEKEARIHATLKHPKIVQVYHLEEDPHTHTLYLICEYANGGSLAEHLNAYGPLSEPQAIQIALDICAALEAVAGNHFVHRDIKPANILLFKDNQGQISEAKLADFGVAMDLDPQRAGQPSTQRGGSHPGTVLYMPPEQANIANPLDVTADLFAFGISLWEMLTGTDYKLSRTPAGPPALPTHNPLASQGIAEIIQRAVRDDPRDRYATPRAMCADLQAVRDGRSLVAAPTIQLPFKAPARRVRFDLVVAAVLVLSAMLALGGYVWQKSGPAPLRGPALISNSTAIPAPTVLPTPILAPTVLPTPMLPWVYTREAETPDQSTVGQTLSRQPASGGEVHGQFGTVPDPAWPARSGHVIYNITSVSQITHWYLQLRFSKNSSASVPILIFLDNEPEPRARFYPIDQGSWDSFAWTEPIDLGTIRPGLHAILFSTEGQQYGVIDLDRFVLTTVPPSVVPAPTPATP